MHSTQITVKLREKCDSVFDLNIHIGKGRVLGLQLVPNRLSIQKARLRTVNKIFNEAYAPGNAGHLVFGSSQKLPAFIGAGLTFC